MKSTQIFWLQLKLSCNGRVCWSSGDENQIKKIDETKELTILFLFSKTTARYIGPVCPAYHKGKVIILG